ncbi:MULTISPECIES: hypothetical protein [Photobacterium]|uniref:hypothetical protein n=1 Tax=Photobacterium TaxID=657 RepID=UPI001C2DAF62|nr:MULTISPECIES: hypothetical protein [Photobacterium]MBV1840441.1 hypothetical protein [Photobacterium ganghwense]
MTKASFLLFCVMGIICMALLQLIDASVGILTPDQYLLEWGALDAIWISLLALAVYENFLHRE